MNSAEKKAGESPLQMIDVFMTPQSDESSDDNMSPSDKIKDKLQSPEITTFAIDISEPVTMKEEDDQVQIENDEEKMKEEKLVDEFAEK